MRILFTVDLPLLLGWGVGNSVRRLARCMAQMGHTPALLQPRCDIPSSNEDKGLFTGGIFCCPASSYPVWYRPRSWASVLRTTYQLRKAIREFRADIIHVNFLGWVAIPLALLIRLPRRWKVVVTLRGSELTIGPSRDSPLAILWQRRVLQHCESVTAPSQAALKEAIDLYPWLSSKASVIYNGLDMDVFPRVDERVLLSPREGALFVGRLHEDKGVDVLLKAWRRLQDKGITMPLSICGDGPERESLQRLKLGLNLQLVEFLGRKDIKELIPLYQSCTLLVLPSRSETFGNVLVEASYLGCVCIGSRIGGIPDVIGDEGAGFLVPPENPIALAEVVEQFLEMGKVQQDAMRLKAHRRVKELFSAEVEARNYAQLFEQVRSR